MAISLAITLCPCVWFSCFSSHSRCCCCCFLLNKSNGIDTIDHEPELCHKTAAHNIQRNLNDTAFKYTHIYFRYEADAFSQRRMATNLVHIQFHWVILRSYHHYGLSRQPNPNVTIMNFRKSSCANGFCNSIRSHCPWNNRIEFLRQMRDESYNKYRISVKWKTNEDLTHMHTMHSNGFFFHLKLSTISKAK